MCVKKFYLPTYPHVVYTARPKLNLTLKDIITGHHISLVIYHFKRERNVDFAGRMSLEQRSLQHARVSLTICIGV